MMMRIMMVVLTVAAVALLPPLRGEGKRERERPRWGERERCRGQGGGEKETF